LIQSVSIKYPLGFRRLPEAGPQGFQGGWGGVFRRDHQGMGQGIVRQAGGDVRQAGGFQLLDAFAFADEADGGDIGLACQGVGQGFALGFSQFGL
jgi:hypothetical protein